MKAKQEFTLDLHQVSEIWRFGSVVRSWLLDLVANALGRNPNLKGVRAYVADSGKGRWTVAESTDLKISAPVITIALLQRLLSREQDSFADKLLATLGQQFGGHAVETTSLNEAEREIA